MSSDEQEIIDAIDGIVEHVEQEAVTVGRELGLDPDEVLDRVRNELAARAT